MANELRFDSANEVIGDMLDIVENIEYIVNGFSKRTQSFSEQIDAELTDAAIDLVDSITDKVQRLRAVVEARLEKSGEAMTKLHNVTLSHTSKINHIR